MKDNATFFVLYSLTSCTDMCGQIPMVGTATGKSIIEKATKELAYRNQTLDEMAGIESIADAAGKMVQARELTTTEALDLSIEKLGDNGRFYNTFSTDHSGATDFVESAMRHGVAADAQSVVDLFMAQRMV